ncbi:MAG TPA: NAD(P)/FAD-dependent oxidoreductase [Candidatus Limnocylindrales bacterium]|nr:NAD(P)/FAD-dependent oxidoreductase [Candidatus Limnocylindrales bacterium]
MVRSFDEGSTTVPGDIARPVERVVVVGAGMAGLATANAVARAGIDVVVLEARDRIGGRTHTGDVGGSPVDLGAAWIHTPIGNPMSDLADDLGIERRSWNILDGVALWDDVGRLPSEEARRLMDLSERFYEALPDLRADLGRGATAVEGIDRFLAGTEIEHALRAALRELLVRLVEADASGPAGDIPLRGHPAGGTAYGGDEMGDVPVGGYRRVVDALAAGLDIRLGTEVVEVAAHAGGVDVRTADGAVHVGSHVLVTVPLGVLKAGVIRFDPPLLPERRSAIERLGFGRLDKVALRYERPFWTEQGLPFIEILAASEPFDGPFGLDVATGEPVMVVLAGGSGQGWLMEGTVDQAVDRVRAAVERVTGLAMPVPVAATRTDWSGDPFSRGAYSYVSVAASPADLDLLGEPHGGRILFAGEATTSARVGYADGALSTGIREAKRLLGRPEIQLGRLPA